MSKNFLFTDANGFYEESAGAYEEADFINTSAGVGDAGKPIVLDAAGLIDDTMIDVSGIDHGALGDLRHIGMFEVELLQGVLYFRVQECVTSDSLVLRQDTGSVKRDPLRLSQLQ